MRSVALFRIVFSLMVAVLSGSFMSSFGFSMSSFGSMIGFSTNSFVSRVLRGFIPSSFGLTMNSGLVTSSGLTTCFGRVLTRKWCFLLRILWLWRLRRWWNVWKPLVRRKRRLRDMVLRGVKIRRLVVVMRTRCRFRRGALVRVLVIVPRVRRDFPGTGTSTWCRRLLVRRMVRFLKVW